MPDGTFRQGVGDIVGSVIKVGDKIGALKSVQITKGSRKNWFTAITYLLKRLAVASNNDVDSIWKSITAVLSAKWTSILQSSFHPCNSRSNQICSWRIPI